MESHSKASVQSRDILVICGYIAVAAALFCALTGTWLALYLLVLFLSPVAPFYWHYLSAHSRRRTSHIKAATAAQAPLELPRRTSRLLCVMICSVLILPTVYLASYFALGRHTTGIDFRWFGSKGREFTYHDRAFPFDPWIFKPIAHIEYRMRGKRSQIVISDGSYRGGQPIYGYGPFE